MQCVQKLEQLNSSTQLDPILQTCQPAFKCRVFHSFKTSPPLLVWVINLPPRSLLPFKWQQKFQIRKKKWYHMPFCCFIDWLTDWLTTIEVILLFLDFFFHFYLLLLTYLISYISFLNYIWIHHHKHKALKIIWKMCFVVCLNKSGRLSLRLTLFFPGKIQQWRGDLLL